MTLTAAEKIWQFRKRHKKKGLAEEMKMTERGTEGSTRV
jgi:hypothetical protein